MAERLGIEYGEDLHLMQDLGWAEGDGREAAPSATTCPPSR
jgi:hypothetical protein